MSDKSNDVPKGFACTACGKFHEFSFYVYAHTRDKLVHTCDCGARHTIVNLRASPEKTRAKTNRA